MSRLDQASLLDRGGPADQLDDDPQFVAAVARGIAVLEAFDQGSEKIGTNEIAERAGVPRATASRIAYTLVKLGYLKLDAASQKYRLGARVVALARHYMGSRGAIDVARPILREFAERFEAATALTERDGLDMVYVDYHRSEGAVVVTRGVGSRAPLVRSAAGRAYLASTDARERAFLRDRLAARGEDRAAMDKILAEASSDLVLRGFAASHGGWTRHVNAIAAPFRAPVDGTLMAISVAAPAFIIAAERFESEIGPALVHALRQKGFVHADA
jgi:DNA-binding IclR family transcriptional regulator